MERVAELALVLAQFQLEMARQLKKNEHKGNSWQEDEVGALLKRLKEETAELEEAIKSNYGRSVIRQEAADVANFAMFVADMYWPERAGVSLPN